MNTQKMIDITNALPGNLNFITPRRSGKTTAAIKLADALGDEVAVCTNNYEQFKYYQHHLGHRVRYLPYNGFKHRYFAVPAFKLAIIDDIVLNTRDNRFLFERYLKEMLKLCDRVLVFSSRYAEIDAAVLAQRHMTTITLPPPTYTTEWETALRQEMGDQQFNAMFKNEWLAALDTVTKINKLDKMDVDFK